MSLMTLAVQPSSAMICSLVKVVNAGWLHVCTDLDGDEQRTDTMMQVAYNW